MKKRLIPGGLRYALPVIRAAHGPGTDGIAADDLPGSIAHQYADEFCSVSMTDLEAALKAAAKRPGWEKQRG